LIGALLGLRITLAVLSWQPGWSALGWDDFAHVALAGGFAAEPELAHQLVWLPLPVWLNGAVFMVFGALAPDNPMLITAVVNMILMIGAAAIAGWSARRLFHTATGGLIAFAAVLFAPWAVWLSLSGLADPLYHLAMAGTVLGTIGWLQTRRLAWLVGAAGSVAAAAACRYEGWALFGAWAAILAAVEVWGPRSGLGRRVRSSHRVLTIIALPALVPVGWVVLNLTRTDDAFFFAKEHVRYFKVFGSWESRMARLMYYPGSLLRAVPLMLAASAVVAVARRRDRIVRALVAILALTFLALWSSSLLSSSVGVFNERYLLAFGIGLAPLLGGIPALLPEAPRLLRRPAAVAALIAALAVTGIRLADRPVEWTHPPDLLTLTAALGRLGTSADPIRVTAGPGMVNDLLPLTVRNGKAVIVVDGSALPPPGPGGVAPGELWIERLPERIAAAGAAPAATIGRYVVYGQVTVDTSTCPGCSGWTLTDETGTERPVVAGPYVPLEFTSDDPAAGAEAVVSIVVPRLPEAQAAVIEMRPTYGHGFNLGRIEVQVRVDGFVVMRRDIAARSRWLTVRMTLPAGGGDTRIEVAVVALPGIETDWEWGRASTVLIRTLRITGG
jgi:hypothetical protein